MAGHCAACTSLAIVSPGCREAFVRIGVTKLHWECWSSCNLHCKFCYRTEDVPLDHESGLRLIDVCAYAGVRTFVFAGGDPSLRSDLSELIDHACASGLVVELQSNFQRFDARVRDRVADGRVSLSGLSLDAATSSAHDGFRSTRGNFRAVISALEFHEGAGAPVIVRTVITRQNWRETAEIAELLSRYEVVKRWSLLQFTPVGRGFANASMYRLDDERNFEDAARTAVENYRGAGEVDIYRSNDKQGTYALVTAAGNLYGVTPEPAGGTYPVVGSMLRDHLSTLAAGLPFSRHRHQVRYGH
ncbi:radical SAM protein [Saccharothrix sp. HUAS TT1]|uniref:radical SAM protein n=1 Tax=unclassified Saccharothrix TaxID=2593673 RepID=UPI00345BAB7A